MANLSPNISQIDDNNQNNGAMENTGPDDKKPSTTNNDDAHLQYLCQEISKFAAYISKIPKSDPLETPQCLNDFLEILESMLKRYDSIESPLSDSPVFFTAIDRLALLIDSVSKFKSVSNSAAVLLNFATSLLHKAMLILGDDLEILLHKKEVNCDDSTLSNDHQEEEKEKSNSENQQQPKDAMIFPSYSPEDLSLICSIAQSMISAGYLGECKRVFLVTRKSAFHEELTSLGLEKSSIDDVHKMQWETLEKEIATWIRVVKRCTSYLFPGELKFYQTIFSKSESVSESNSMIRIVLFDDLVSTIIHQLLNLAHAVAMTKRSSEKLFKFLDMYETVRDIDTWLNESCLAEECIQELRSEIAGASSRLGEEAALIFCELEDSIKSDNTKQPVACGAVHPLTRYVMNYLKYACEYKTTLEEVFLKHLNTSNRDYFDESDEVRERRESTTPFTAQLMTVLDLLDENLEAKSQLYKEMSLRYIFLMNNGRYMLQKIKGSAEMHESLVDLWCRKRTTDVRSYHKNYQRDTWGKVLQCLAQEGLVEQGKVLKPVLKERFKNFNQLFDEIHKSQSTWVVSDEQLQTELRVSISAVMIPAYRGFIGRFGQIFTEGRQYEKHVKYQPEDIENAIEELFDGNSKSMGRKT